jgi:hypothetical protein
VLLPWTPPDPGSFPGDPGAPFPSEPAPGGVGPLVSP